MIHSISELYRVQGSGKLVTKEVATIIAHHSITRPALSKQHNGDTVKIIDTDGVKTIYMFGEKTWFDTQEELNEYRAQYHAEQKLKEERRRVQNAIIAELNRMSTEQLQEVLESIVGVV